MVTVEGFITVDVSDYSDDIAIVADTEEIIEKESRRRNHPEGEEGTWRSKH